MGSSADTQHDAEAVEVESIEWRIYDAKAERIVGEPCDDEDEARRAFGRAQASLLTVELHSRKVSAWEVVE